MSGKSRERIEAAQRMMISYICNRCKSGQQQMNDLTLYLTRASEEDPDELEKSFEEYDNFSYKMKLKELGLHPMTHRIDHNIILIASEAMGKRLKFENITCKPIHSMLVY
jgi:hypothetical protein